MAGEYRSEAALASLPRDVADMIRGGVRLASIIKPMRGVVKLPQLAEKLALAYSSVPGMHTYVEGLRRGTIVPVTADSAIVEKVWRKLEKAQGDTYGHAAGGRTGGCTLPA